MTRIIASADCGNSPKNIFLQSLNIAFAKGDIELILGCVTGDICWNIAGQKAISGIEDLVRALTRTKGEEVLELTIQHVISHGKAGAVNGTAKLKNGLTRLFCDVYEFSSAKGDRVKEITSYVIDEET